MRECFKVRKSICIDFGEDDVHDMQPKSVQFLAKNNHGTAEWRLLSSILCWNCTAHKLQGSTIEQAVFDLSLKLFDASQTYVALSSVKSLDLFIDVLLDYSNLIG